MSTDSDTKIQNSHTRLCHVIKSDNFDGYGFNLHAEKGKPGQYIGKVDEGSPAEAAGLRQGDRIIEVNGACITNETHKQVVQRIKALGNETVLRVIDSDDESISQKSQSDSNVFFEDNITDSNANTSSEKAIDTTTTSANNGQTHTEDNMNNGNGSLNLSMTVAELRAKLATKKKFDPRKESIDFKKKFDTVQKL